MTDETLAIEWDPATLTGPLEAVLMMATEPLPADELARAVGGPTEVVSECLAGLAAWYDDDRTWFRVASRRHRLALLHPLGARCS